MNLKQNGKMKGASVVGGLTVGAVTSVAVTLCCAAVGAAMISTGKIGENVTGYISIGILLLATLIGTLTGTGRVHGKKLYSGLGIAAIYFILLLSMTALFFGGQYERVTVTSFVLLLGAIGGTYLRKGKGSKGNYRRHKNKYR